MSRGPKTRAARPPDWIYLSFATLTTVGYGGITPHGHATRSLAILEALVCQLYPTIVLARLVSLHVAGNRPDTNRPRACASLNGPSGDRLARHCRVDTGCLL
ncbi:potassium channel family protein [Paraburkholderia xenovorans]